MREEWENMKKVFEEWRIGKEKEKEEERKNK